MIKLPDGATEDDHLVLLGVLNSSTACFWLKQNSHNKGEGGGARVDAGYAARGEPFRESYEFTGTTLLDFPLPVNWPAALARDLDVKAQELAMLTPFAVAASGIPSRAVLVSAESTSGVLRRHMISLQEELDWEVYRLYGLIADDLTYSGDLPGISSGERAFEIALARRTASGEEEAVYHPDQVPSDYGDPGNWPADYRELVQRRLDLIESHPFIRLLERPEYKRRWAQEPWEKRQEGRCGGGCSIGLRIGGSGLIRRDGLGRAALPSLPMRSHGTLIWCLCLSFGKGGPMFR